jgi:hypothetical protein
MTAISVGKVKQAGKTFDLSAMQISMSRPTCSSEACIYRRRNMNTDFGREKRGIVGLDHLAVDRPTNHRLMDASFAGNSVLAKWIAVLSDGLQSQLQIIPSWRLDSRT